MRYLELIDFNEFSNISINTTSFIGINIMYAVVFTCIVYAALYLFYSLFVLIYNRAHHNGMIIISEIPLNRKAFIKFFLIFSSLANIIKGLIRLLYLITPLYSYVIENIVKYVLYCGIIIIAFYMLKKYVLSDRTAFATFVAMVIPFSLFIILW
jgi:hypothetical protein